MSTPTERRVGYQAPAGGRSSFSSSGGVAAASPLWQRIRHSHSPNHITANFQHLARPETERRCIDLFWEAYFPSGQPIPANSIRSYTCTWTETARKFSSEDQTLRHVLWATCLLVTGNKHQEPWMLREARRCYGMALAGLRRSLGRSVRQTRGDAVEVATVKLLGMFEVCTGPMRDEERRRGGADYECSLQTLAREVDGRPHDPAQDGQGHHAGEVALFVARTPAAHINGDAHHVFADERVELVRWSRWAIGKA